MPKSRFPKLQGSIFNIPIDTLSVSNVLPYGADSTDLINVKLKHELSYCGQVYFELLLRESLYKALAFLKQNNALYKDVDNSVKNVRADLLDFSHKEDFYDIENFNESLDEGDNPLHSYTFTSQETMFIPHTVTSEEINIAPGEGIEPVSIFSNNIYSEEFAFPCREILLLIPKRFKSKPI